MFKKILETNTIFLLKLLVRIFISLFFLTSAVNAAELNCGTFSGEWNGNKKGAGYKGDLKIVFDDNCKYDIFKKNGKIIFFRG